MADNILKEVEKYADESFNILLNAYSAFEWYYAAKDLKKNDPIKFAEFDRQALNFYNYIENYIKQNKEILNEKEKTLLHTSVQIVSPGMESQ